MNDRYSIKYDIELLESKLLTFDDSNDPTYVMRNGLKARISCYALTLALWNKIEMLKRNIQQNSQLLREVSL